MSILLRKRSLTAWSCEPAGYLIAGGRCLYRSVAFEPRISQGNIIEGALLGGMLIVPKLIGAGPKIGDCAEAEVVLRGEFGGETPGGATSV